VITCDGKLWSCKGLYGDLKKENLRQIWFSLQAQKIRETVNKCKAHCLQDCVYFPMDISGQVEHFLSGIEDGPDNANACERIISRIDYCINELAKRIKPGWLGNFDRRRSEICKLNILKKELLKNHKPAA
jgi:hypothetical protein